MLGNYLMAAFRNFLRQKVGTSINVLCLALGLAAFIVAYSVVRYLETAERHFANADRIYLVSTEFRFPDGRSPINTLGTAEHVARYLKQEFPQLEAVFRVRGMGDTAISTGSEKVSVPGAATESAFLDAFDLRFVSGNPSTSLSAPRSVLITTEVAHRLFGPTAALGRTVTLDGLTDATVTGVFESIPDSSIFDFEVLVSWDIHEAYMAAIAPPNRAEPSGEEWRGNLTTSTYALLPEDAGPVGRQRFLSRLAAFADKYIPESQKHFFATIGFTGIEFNALEIARLDQSVLPNLRGSVSITTILIGLGVLILTLACINYANLATAQSADRLKEIGTRRIVGASVGDTILQTLSLAAVHVLLSLVLALLLVGLMSPAIDRTLDVDISRIVLTDVGLWRTIPLAVLAVIAGASAYPALYSSSVSPSRALKAAASTRPFGFSRTVLVGIQFSAACLLLAFAVVMYHQTEAFRRGALGETEGSVFLVGNNLNDARISLDTYISAHSLIDGIESISAMTMRPWSGSGVWIASRAPTPDAPRLAANLLTVGDDFFETLRIPLLAGRALNAERAADLTIPDGFPAAGKRQDNPTSVVIDRPFAESMGFTDVQQALDQLLYIPPEPPADVGAWRAFRVIGVAAERALSIQNFGAVGNVYQLVPRTQVPLLRISARNIERTLAEMKGVWDRLAPDIPFDVRFFDATFDLGYRPFATFFYFLNGLVVLAISIAIAGLVVMSIHESRHRYHEIAIRKTLGASTVSIAWDLLRSFSVPVVIGNLVALPLAYMAARSYLNMFLFRIDLTAWPFVFSVVTTLLVAWLAVGFQVLRAARLNPATVLRYE